MNSGTRKTMKRLDALKAGALALGLFGPLVYVYPPNLPENADHDISNHWLEILFFVSLGVGLFVLLALDAVKASFDNIRWIYTGISVGLTVYRIVLYAHHGWILFQLDLCPVGQLFLLYTLWKDDRLNDVTWMQALYGVLVGPIAGSTFLLSTKFSIDNAEVFMSFFLHVAPQWLWIPFRWRIFQPELSMTLESQSTCDLVQIGMLKFYLRWAVFMGCFLTAQPFIPGISHMMTLYDWMAGDIMGYEPIIPRDMPFWKWTLFAWIYIAAHAALASYGMLMASLSYRYRPVYNAYVGCVILSILIRSVRHYYFQIDHTLAEGACEIVAAGMIVTATYYWQINKKDSYRTSLMASPLE